MTLSRSRLVLTTESIDYCGGECKLGHHLLNRKGQVLTWSIRFWFDKFWPRLKALTRIGMPDLDGWLIEVGLGPNNTPFWAIPNSNLDTVYPFIETSSIEYRESWEAHTILDHLDLLFIEIRSGSFLVLWIEKWIRALETTSLLYGPHGTSPLIHS